jgi:3-mercaptopyruvate sulfurtransferase SseA
MTPSRPAKRLRAIAQAMLFWATAGVALADGLSAHDAQAALAGGAMAWDVREAPATLIPGAVQVTPVAMQRWLRGEGSAALAQAVSAAGLDLSRDVVIYGVAGDAQAQALHDSLTRLASGRVRWLVGGIDEWQAAGLPTVARPTQRPPVPQHLVDLAPAPGELAAPALRRSGPDRPVVAALVNVAAR